MGDDDWSKPQIRIASSWNEITPCNLSLARLAQAAKEGVHAGGGYPLPFGTISVSDGISMGHEGMHFSLVSREVGTLKVRVRNRVINFAPTVFWKSSNLRKVVAR